MTRLRTRVAPPEGAAAPPPAAAAATARLTPSLPSQVAKRDGRRAAFELGKIAHAIARAGGATGEFDRAEADRLAASVGRVIAHRFANTVPDIESIQDVVEHALAAAGFFDTARAYIVYRDRHARLRDQRRTLVDVAASVDEYLEQKDWRVNANANQGYSLGGLILNVSGKVVANYWLSHVYAAEIGQAHRDGDVHIHDLDMLAGYCAGWSLRQLLHEGLNGVPGKVESGPPKHMSSAVGQIVNFLGTLQNEWAGAQAFSSFDTYMAPFVRRDAMTYAEVKQCIQELIYNLNVPSRWGTQTPFTNLTFDWVCPDDLREQIPVIAGVEMPFAYGELQAEMDLINRAYIEVMTEGDAKGRVFTFPIPTYNITPDFDWDHPNCEALFTMTAKYGLPYFQNFLNSELKPNMIRSMCCRLQLDLRELLKRGNGLFGSAEQTGSLGVVTINCARLGYLHAGDAAALYRRLDELLRMARDSLEIKRKVIQRLIDQGLFPYTKRYLGTLRNHFSTIGVNGINEMIRNFSRDADDITTRVRPCLRRPPARPPARAHRRHPGGDRPHVQPRGHAGGRHDLPLRQGGPQALAGHPAGGYAGHPVLHQFVAAAGRLHRRPLRGAGAAGGAAVEVHRRHRAAPLHERAHQLGIGLQDAGAARAGALSPALHHRDADVLDLPDARLPGRRAPFLPQMRRRTPGREATPAGRVKHEHLEPFSHVRNNPKGAGNMDMTAELDRTAAPVTLSDAERQRCEVWTRVMGYHRPVASFNIGKQGEHGERQYFRESRVTPRI